MYMHAKQISIKTQLYQFLWECTMDSHIQCCISNDPVLLKHKTSTPRKLV